MNDFSPMHIDVVKTYLTDRGISTSGKKKVELVALAYSCSILNIEPIPSEDDALKALSNECAELTAKTKWMTGCVTLVKTIELHYRIK